MNSSLDNVALFGKTAKQWRDSNPGKNDNMRDEADLNQLLVLANMESYNAIMIEQGKLMSERLVLLREYAIKQMKTLAIKIFKMITKYADIKRKYVMSSSVHDEWVRKRL